MKNKNKKETSIFSSLIKVLFLIGIGTAVLLKRKFLITFLQRLLLNINIVKKG